MGKPKYKRQQSPSVVRCHHSHDRPPPHGFLKPVVVENRCWRKNFFWPPGIGHIEKRYLHAANSRCWRKKFFRPPGFGHQIGSRRKTTFGPSRLSRFCFAIFAMYFRRISKFYFQSSRFPENSRGFCLFTFAGLHLHLQLKGAQPWGLVEPRS